jgi:hypothetical protein
MSKIAFVFASIDNAQGGPDVREVMFRRGSAERWYVPTISSWIRMWRALLPVARRLSTQQMYNGSCAEIKL